MTMKTIQPIPAAARASALLGLAIGSLGLFIGCSGDGPAAPERTWEEVRYHWSAVPDGESFGDLIVRSSGEMVWDLQGERAPSRGLLAGGNLETLTRLIDALPPAGYQGQQDCNRVFFVTVASGGTQVSYSAGGCDASAPAALRELASGFDSLVDEATSHRTTVVPVRVLARGTQSRVVFESRRVAANRDQLLSMLDLLGAGRPPLISGVDFRREIVVGVFLGDRSSAGFEVDVTGAYRTEGGKLVLVENWSEPGPDCVSATLLTRPYALVAVEAQPGEDFVSEVGHTRVDCGAGAP
jgi:hypothetical protein